MAQPIPKGSIIGICIIGGIGALIAHHFWPNRPPEPTPVIVVNPPVKAAELSPEDLAKLQEMFRRQTEELKKPPVIPPAPPTVKEEPKPEPPKAEPKQEDDPPRERKRTSFYSSDYQHRGFFGRRGR